jgi:hypothetical protein
VNYDKLKSIIGIPWVYKETDCWAIFKRGSLELFNIDVNDLTLPSVSDTDANITIFKSELKPPKWNRIDKCHAGCAVVFCDTEGDPIHVGLAIDDKSVLHSMGAPGINTSSRIDKIKVILKHKYYSRCEFYDYGI